MYSEFITRITYNFPLETFMVVGMGFWKIKGLLVGRKDEANKEDIRWKIPLSLIRPCNTGRRLRGLLRIGFSYVPHRRKTMNLHHVCKVDECATSRTTRIQSLSSKLQIRNYIEFKKGTALIVCQTAEIELCFLRNPFWTVDV